MWQTYPYLFADLLGLIPVALAALLFPKHRRGMAIAGLFFLPAAARGLQYVEYWHPARLLPGPVVLEDLLYLIAVGTMSWFLAIVGWLGSRTLVFDAGVNARRYLTLGAVAVFTGGICTLAGLDSMTSDMAAMVVAALWVLARQPALIRLAASGFVLFGTYHYMQQHVWFALWPSMVRAWNPATAWAQLFGGIPLGEVVFHYAFGAAAPLAIAWCRNGVVAENGRVRV